MACCRLLPSFNGVLNMRPSGRIKKLSRTHCTVVLATWDDGTLVPTGIEGFEFNRQIEEDVERIASWAEPQAQVEKSVAELHAEIETLHADGKLGQKAMNSYALRLLGYKKANFSSSQRESARMEEQVRARIWDYHQMIGVAAILAKKQGSYLTSRDELDKTKVTYTEIASYFDNASESTIRRLVKEVRLKVGTWIVSASDLITRSGMTEVCRELANLRESYPHAGAPKLHILLKDKGFEVSRRTVGSALSLLNKSLFLL